MLLCLSVVHSIACVVDVFITCDIAWGSGVKTASSPYGKYLVACYRSYRAEEKKQGSLMQEIIERPLREITVGLKRGTYDKLDDDGIAPPGTRVSGAADFIDRHVSASWQLVNCDCNAPGCS